MATRWGILSAGKISSDFVTAMKCLPAAEHRLVAVAARSLEAAQQFAKKHGIEKAYGSYEELANDSDIEVVYVGTINPYHLSSATLMLNCGKHCLVEKPLCMNVKESKQLINLAREKALFLMEAIWSRCFPIYEEITKRIQNGDVGEVISVICSLGLPLSNVPNISDKDLGGSVVLAIGIYAVQFVSLVMGGEPPCKILAGGSLNEQGVDETISATLVYPNGRVASILASTRTKLPNEGVVCGTKGTLKVHDPICCPEYLTSISGQYYSKFTNDALDKYNFPNSEGLKFEATEVRRCIQNGLMESPKITLDESLLIADIMEALRKGAGVVYND